MLVAPSVSAAAVVVVRQQQQQDQVQWVIEDERPFAAVELLGLV